MSEPKCNCCGGQGILATGPNDITDWDWCPGCNGGDENPANRKTNLIQLGDFPLHSGNHSWFKLVADHFIEENLEGLVELILKLIGPFSSVEGIPTGGEKLAAELNKYKTNSKVHPHLIVDDVLTTGGSFEKVWEAAYERDGKPEFIRPSHYINGAVVFARGKCPPWVKAIFQLPRELWLK